MFFGFVLPPNCPAAAFFRSSTPSCKSTPAMAALQPLSEGHPTPSLPAQRSFLDALSGKSCEPFNPKQPSSFRGKPHVHFDAVDIDRYSKAFNHALIGKFSNGRPSMERIRKAFIGIGFSGQYTIGLIDYRHLIIRFTHEEDYIRCFLKRTWSIDGFVMRVLKWHYKFSVDTECSIVPVWVKFPLLPLHLFHKEALYSIARLVGEPLKLDASTSSFNRPSVARVCVEMDLLKELVTEVWITQMDFGFWQSVEYDDLPSYCSCCNKVGHTSEICRQASTSAIAAQTKKIEAPKPAAPPRQHWQIKQPIPVTQPSVVISAAAEISPRITEHVAAPVLDAHLGTQVASALPVQSAPVLPKDLSFPATFAAKSPQCADVSAGVAHIPLAASTVSASSVPIHASSCNLSVITEECSPPPQFSSPILDAVSQDSAAAERFLRPFLSAPTFLQPPPDASLSPRAGTLQIHSHLQHTLLPSSSSAPSPLPKEPVKSYADILLGVQQSGTPSSVSFMQRFLAIKSAEYPSLPLPNFRIFFSARPLFPQDSLVEPQSPRPADSFQLFSEGDDVPRQPIQRKQLSIFLRSSYLDLNAKLRKGRRPAPISFNRKKWKKLSPFSRHYPTSTSNTSTNNAPPMAEEDPGNDTLVEYESNWHSSTSDDEADSNCENLLGYDEEFLSMEYSDFSFALPLQSRRKYNKRFRDLPPPLRTRSSRQH